MDRVRFTYARFKQLIHESFKFGIVGLVGILVLNVVFDPLHYHLGLGALTSLTIATIVATVITYLGNRFWSFRHREGGGTRRETTLFFALNAVGMLIQYAVLGVSDHLLGLNSKADEYIALNLGIGIGTLFRFWSYRKWVWVPPEEHLRRLRRGRHRMGRPIQLREAALPRVYLTPADEELGARG